MEGKFRIPGDIEKKSLETNSSHLRRMPGIIEVDAITSVCLFIGISICVDFLAKGMKRGRLGCIGRLHIIFL